MCFTFAAYTLSNSMYIRSTTHRGKLGMIILRYLYVQDRKHWELLLGPITVARWCAGSPCSWHGYGGRHPVRITR